MAILSLLTGCTDDDRDPGLRDGETQVGGETPSSFPDDFPLPDGSQFVLASGDDYQFNAPGTDQAVLEFFEDSLATPGVSVTRVPDAPLIEFTGKRCGEITVIELDEGGVRFNIRLEKPPCGATSATSTTPSTSTEPLLATTLPATTIPPTAPPTPPPTTQPPTSSLAPGSPCALGSDPNCIDPDGDGNGEYLRYGAECMADLAPDLGPGICTDLDGDGIAGYPDSG